MIYRFLEFPKIIYKRIIKLWRRHFSLIILFALTVLLISALVSQGKNWIASLLFGITGFVSFIVFYGIYVFKFKTLSDLFPHREYYYNLYGWWGITFFSAMFVSLFAFIIFFLNSNLPPFLLVSKQTSILTINNASPFAVLIFLVEKILDTILLGTLETYDIRFINLDVNNNSFLGKSVFHLCKLLIEIFITASVVYLYSQIRDINKELQKLQLEDLSKGSILRSLDPLKVRLCLDYLNANWDSQDNRIKMLNILKYSENIEVRDIFLKALNQPKDLETFVLGVNYFKTNRDKRFSKVIRAIKDPSKKKILANMEIIKK